MLKLLWLEHPGIVQDGLNCVDKPDVVVGIGRKRIYLDTEHDSIALRKHRKTIVLEDVYHTNFHVVHSTVWSLACFKLAKTSRLCPPGTTPTCSDQAASAGHLRRP